MNKRTPIEWALILWIIVSGAAATTSVIPFEPWGQFITAINTGLLGWELIRKPSKEDMQEFKNRNE